MKVTFDIPEELFVMAMTLIAPRLPDGSVHTFTHCFTLQDGKTVRVEKEEQDGKPFYRAYERMQTAMTIKRSTEYARLTE